MRFGFYCTEQTSMFAWRRLQDEGHEVAIYIPPKYGHESQIGDGIVNKVRSIPELAQFVGKSGVIVWEGNGDGKVADQLRAAGYNVLCGGKFCERLEEDRAYGIEIAKEIGVAAPPYTQFAKLSEAAAFVKRHPDKSFFFKTDKYLESDATRNAKTTQGMVQYLEWMKGRFGDDIPCILQEKIEGTAFSTAWYWNGRTIIGPIEGTIEHKKYLNDDLGPSTGCQFNLVWFYDRIPKIYEALNLDKLQEIFRRESAPPGIYDINAVIAKADGEPYFLEWTPRFGYDSEPTAQLLVRGDLAELYSGVALGTIGSLPVFTAREAAAYSIRLSIPPYPWEFADKDKKKTCLGSPIPINPDAPLWKGFIGYQLKREGKHLSMADSYGLVGLAATIGSDLETMHKYCLKVAERLDIQGLGYRTDGNKVLAKDLKAVRALGYGDVPRL